MSWCAILEKDLPRIIEIERAVHLDPWQKEVFLRCIHAAFLFVGKRIHEAIEAYLIVEVRSPEWHILNLAVSKEHQRQGIARALLSELMQYFSEKKADCIHLEVRASNAPAIQLYQSFGFVEVGRRKDYYAAVDDYPAEDAVLFSIYRSSMKF